MSTSLSKRMTQSRYRWELQMKNFSVLPLVVGGVIGGVYLIQFHVAPAMNGAAESKPRLAVAPAPPVGVTPQPAAAAAPQKSPAITAQGRVVAQKDLEIKSKTCGIVKSVAIEIGDTVKQDQLLAELDPADALKQVRRADASLAASKSRLEQARESLTIAQMSLASQNTRAGACIKSATAKASRARSRADRIKEALKKCAISQEENDEAEATAVEAAANLELSKVQLEDVKTQEMTLDLRRRDVACAEAQVTLDEIALQDAQLRLAETKIVAPMAGVVTAKTVQPGQFIAAGTSSAETSLLTISDLSRLYVHARIAIGQISEIKLGQAAAIRTETGSGEAFRGRVVFVAPCGTNTGKDVTVCVKIELPDEVRGRLKPETPVSVQIEK